MSTEEFNPTDEQRKAAESLAQSFAAGSRKIGPDQLRKITQAGMTILGTAGNRFVRGFDAAGVKDLQGGNLMPYAPDVVQWREVCAADRDTLRRWMGEPDAFRNHWQDVMLDSPVQMDRMAEMFYDVFDAYQEIINSQVITKEDKSAKGKGTPPKKKAPSRAKRRNTSSR